MPNTVINTALNRHPDGFGLAWRENGALKTARFGPTERRAFRKTLKRLDRRTDTEYVAHFRWATHGPKVRELAHPYVYADPEVGDVAVFHNGIIDIDTQDGESDTQVFVRDVLAHLPSRWWASSALRYLVGESIGWSRLVIMTATETVNLQEADGNWDRGIWYSSNHKPTQTYTSKASTSGLYVPTTWNGTQAKSAADSARALGLLDAESSTEKAVVPYVASRGYSGSRRSDFLRHAGHKLTALMPVNFDHDGDYPQGVTCDECYTIGDLYIIDGTYYVDMAHRSGAYLDDPREEEVGENDGQWDEEAALPEVRMKRGLVAVH